MQNGGPLYNELDDLVQTLKSNLSVVEELAATIYEVSQSNDLLTGRLQGIARYVQNIPIVSPPVPPPQEYAPTVDQRTPMTDDVAQQIAAANAAAHATPNGKDTRPWSVVLDEMNRKMEAEGIPRKTVPAR